MSKYDKFDKELFSWLEKKKTGITTADAIESLGIQKDRTKQRHISRRFSQLEDRGIIKCDLKGTTRICKLVADLPKTMAKKVIKSPHLRTYPQPRPVHHCDRPSIPAADSQEFVANGGVIEVLPNTWDKPRVGSKPMGPSIYDIDD